MIRTPKLLRLISCLALLCTCLPAWGGDGDTVWTGTTGSYMDKDNWSNGVPEGGGAPTDYVYIGNGGTAILNFGDVAFAENLRLGHGEDWPDSAGGHILINGGQFNTGYNDIYMYDPENNVGSVSFTIEDGLYRAWQHRQSASNHDNLFTQNGGWVRIINYNGAPTRGRLFLSADSETPSGQRLVYALNDGELTVGAASLSGGARMEQAGGTSDFGALEIGGISRYGSNVFTSNSTYQVTGGQMRVYRSFLLEEGGTLDFADQAVSVTLGGLIDLRDGQITGASNASVTIAPNSLVLLPEGKTGADLFGGGFVVDPTSNVADAGSPLTITAGNTVQGWGQWQSFTTVAGGLQAADLAGVADFAEDNGAIQLRGGLFVDGGNVDLGVTTASQALPSGNGVVYVNEAASGINGGSLKTHLLIVGQHAQGSFTQSGGSVDVGFGIRLGSTYQSDIYEQPGAAGTYLLEDGVLEAKSVAVGETGTGTFHQTGGTAILVDLQVGTFNRINNYLPDGRFYLEGGLAEIGFVNVATGDGSTGHMEVTGGTLDAGIIRVSGGEGSQATVSIQDGTISTESIRIGREGSATWTQTGGSVSTRTWFSAAGELSGESVAAELSGGSLSVGFVLTVGKGAGTGSFTVSGPAELSAGTLEVGNGGTGSLHLGDAGAKVTLREAFVLGSDGTYTAVAGSQIRMTGSNLEIKSQDPAKLTGLAQTSFQFEGGPDVLDTAEAAGPNVPIGAFLLGGELPSRLKLVDLFDNDSATPAPESMVLSELAIGDYSVLVLDGLELVVDGQAVQAGRYGRGWIVDSVEDLETMDWSLVGDVDIDGDVDADDEAILFSSLGTLTGATWAMGDLNFDGAVDEADQQLLQDNFNSELGPNGFEAIPEPASLAVLLLGSAGLLGKRRRSSRAG